MRERGKRERVDFKFLKGSFQPKKIKETVKALDLEWIQATFVDKNSIHVDFIMVSLIYFESH